MAKVKVINRRQGSDLIGANFQNIASETIFSFGNFTVGTNFGVRVVRDYRNTLSSFVKPITLDTLNISEDDSQHIYNYTQSILLNFDRTDLTSYARFGSLSEVFRVAVENIIITFPASIYVTYQQSTFVGLDSVTNYSYNQTIDVASFIIPVPATVNKFGLVYNQFNNQLPQNDPLRNLNVSFAKYFVWRPDQPDNNSYSIIGFTGFTTTYQYLNVQCKGNPFPELTGVTHQGTFNYHLKPQPIHYNKFLSNLTDLEQYLLYEKVSGRTGGYRTLFKAPTVSDDGNISYNNQAVLWTSFDQYNIDVDGYGYNVYLDALGTIGSTYDQFKTDLMIRLLVPQSILENDTTDSQKMTKLLRIYGTSFDYLKIYIDALVTINKLSYDKTKNVPDVLVKNLAKTLGWDGAALIQEDDLLEGFFSTNYKKPNELTPSEVDIELWRRILINSNYLYKTKGTREAIKTMFLMLGIPDPFINITEYVYTVDSKIDPNTVSVNLVDLPSATLPYNNEGYPAAPIETNTFYFQISGNSDSGQAYMNNFRTVGFSLNRTPDNKKSWVQSGATDRVHYSTPTYYQEDSKLVLNTKEVDVTLDIARGIEYDVYKYNVANNFPISTSGVTIPYIYINIPFTYGVSANIFSVPEIPQGDIQVSFNGITLVKGNSPSDTQADYYIDPLNPQNAILVGGTAQSYTNGYKDVITLTYVKDQSTGGTYSQIDYVVTKINSAPDGMTIPLIELPLGETQLVVDGKTMTKSSSLFTGDYITNPSNPQELIIVNNDLKNYLIANPIVVISYIKSTSNEPILKKSEVYRIDSFSATKFFFNGVKYVYVLDYEPPTVKAVKIVINGITLQNGVDFTLNASNRKQVLFNTQALSIGYIINAFYVTSTSTGIPFNFGNTNISNISQMSFLQYLNLINTRLINVKNRKTLSDHEGGIYPTVQKLYEEYLKMAYAQPPLVPSNGYTFSNVYPFINKFNSFFHRFIDAMLSATIILNKGGVLIRNTDFTKQKFPYRRGVNFDPVLQYLGDDGSEFKRRIPDIETTYAWTGITCVNSTPQTTTTTTTTISPTTTTTTVAPISFWMVGNYGQVSRSDDGGITWSDKSIPSSLDATLTSFIMQGTSFVGNAGYVIGSSGGSIRLYKTTDGGNTWSNLSTAMAGKSSLETLFAIDANNFIVGTSYGNTGNYYSNDGGSTIPLYIKNIAMIMAKFAYISSTTGCVISTFPNLGGTTVIAKTVSTNTSFTSVNPAGINISSVYPYDISFNGNTGYFGGLTNGNGVSTPEGFLYKTTDGGSTWSPITMPNNAMNINCLRILSNNTIIIAGTNNSITTNYICRSTDGGSTWTTTTFAVSPYYIGGFYTYNGMEFYNNSIGIILLNSNNNTGTQSYYTTNGGVIWNASMASSNNLFGLAVAKNPII